jgi:hypothetical protein
VADERCALCGASGVPLALSSKSGFKRTVCASVSACRQRRKTQRLVAEVAALTAERDQLRTELADAEEVGALSEAGRMDARAERDTLAAFAEHLGGLVDASVAREHALAARLAQAERVVEAARAWAGDGPSLDGWRIPASPDHIEALLAAVDALDGTAGPDALEAARRDMEQARAGYVASVRSRIGLGTAGPGEEGSDG